MWRRHKKTLQPSPQPSWHLTRWAKSASWHCARHLWWLAENIFTTWLWSRSHPALASFSPCTTKDWFILWFAACQRFTGPLSPRYSGMFDMPCLQIPYPNMTTMGPSIWVTVIEWQHWNNFIWTYLNIEVLTFTNSPLFSYYSPRSWSILLISDHFTFHFHCYVPGFSLCQPGSSNM